MLLNAFSPTTLRPVFDLSGGSREPPVSPPFMFITNAKVAAMTMEIEPELKKYVWVPALPESYKKKLRSLWPFGLGKCTENS